MFVYNKSPMHLPRLTAGLLTISLGMGVLMIGAFHGERGIAPEADHASAHIDSIVVDDEAVAFHSADAESSCHANAQQAVITQSPGQSTFSVQIAHPAPAKIFVGGESRTYDSHAFIGRNPPLFEHASLFAATVSMRI